MKGICANGLLCTVRIRLVARAWGFQSRRDVLLNLLWKRKSYKLIEVYHTSTHFEMCFCVTLPKERGPYSLGCRGMCSLKGLKGCGFFKDILIRNRVSILVILVWYGMICMVFALQS